MLCYKKIKQIIHIKFLQNILNNCIDYHKMTGYIYQILMEVILCLKK